MLTLAMVTLSSILASQLPERGPNGSFELREEEERIGTLDVRAGELIQMKPRQWRKDLRVQLKDWERSIAGRTYYLRRPVYPLLANDVIRVARARLKAKTVVGYDGSLQAIKYDAHLSIVNWPPSPSHSFQHRVEGFSSLEEFGQRISVLFSLRPLEDYFDWPQEIKSAVAARVVLLGMDRQMVTVALGGLPYQIDSERLDDGRVRETWKILEQADTRTAFTARRKVVTGMATTTGTAHASASQFGDSSHATSNSSSERVLSVVEAETGFTVFGGLPPSFLHIVFTDGKVTARKTEFVK